MHDASSCFCNQTARVAFVPIWRYSPKLQFRHPADNETDKERETCGADEKVLLCLLYNIIYSQKKKKKT